MKLTILLLCLVCLIGCSPIKEISDGSVPQLLIQSPLPPFPNTLAHPVFELETVMFIMEDGTVGKTRMLKGSGDAAWDSLALSSMKQWRFTPARMENKPIGSWFHMQSTLRYASPQYMNLAEILCTTEEEADSVYRAIEQGQNFNELAMRCSVDPSREMSGILGEVNINLYPENIRKPLGKLNMNEYTEPIKYGDLYAIFKRLKK
jgi:parvulin-like peptidyl-prolyl isomerase